MPLMDVGQRKERIRVSHAVCREAEGRPRLKRLVAASVMPRYLGSTAVAGPGRRGPGRGVLKCALLGPSGQLVSEHGLDVRVLQRWLGSQELEAVARLKIMMRGQANLNLHAGVTPSVWMRRAQMWRRSIMEVTMNSTCTAFRIRLSHGPWAGPGARSLSRGCRLAARSEARDARRDLLLRTPRQSRRTNLKKIVFFK